VIHTWLTSSRYLEHLLYALANEKLPKCNPSAIVRRKRDKGHCLRNTWMMMMMNVVQSIIKFGGIRVCIGVNSFLNHFNIPVGGRGTMFGQSSCRGHISPHRLCGEQSLPHCSSTFLLHPRKYLRDHTCICVFLTIVCLYLARCVTQ